MRYSVNLLPAELQPKPPLSPKKVLLYAFCVFICGFIGFVYGYFHMELNSVREELKFLTQEQEKVKKVQTQMNEINKQQQTIKDQIATIDSLVKNRKIWPMFLLNLSERVPEGVWITNISLSYTPPEIPEPNEGVKPDTQNTSVTEKTKEAVEGVVKEAVKQVLPTEPKRLQNNKRTVNTSNNNGDQAKEKQTVPEAAPNGIVIEGGSYSLESIGKFIYSLNQLQYLSSVNLVEITKDEDAKNVFIIEAPLKEDQ